MFDVPLLCPRVVFSQVLVGLIVGLLVTRSIDFGSFVDESTNAKRKAILRVTKQLTPKEEVPIEFLLHFHLDFALQRKT